MAEICNSTLVAIPASWIGATAREVLRDGVQGRVLAVVSKAVYLETAAGDLLWLHEAGVPHHVRGIQIDHPIGSISVGEGLCMDGTTLRLEGGASIETEGGVVWQPPEPSSRGRLPLSQLPVRWAEFQHAYQPSKPAGILAFGGMLVQGFLPAGFAQELNAGGAFRWNASSLVDGVLERCQAHDLIGTLAQGVGLIGMGGGLTPSGDDYLGGLLFAAFTLARLYDLSWLRCSEEIQAWLQRARERTHAISCALLADHAGGSGAEFLHNFVDLFLTSKPMPVLVHSARQLERLGGSTGSDLIAGVLAGMTLAFPLQSPSGETSRQRVLQVESGR